MLLEIRVVRVYMSLQIYVARETCRWRFMSLEKRVVRDLHNTLDLDFTTATQIRARSQIPVLDLTGRALGLPGSLKLPGASAV